MSAAFMAGFHSALTLLAFLAGGVIAAVCVLAAIVGIGAIVCILIVIGIALFGPDSDGPRQMP